MCPHKPSDLKKDGEGNVYCRSCGETIEEES
jgi:hypothetical protein